MEEKNKNTVTEKYSPISIGNVFSSEIFEQKSTSQKKLEEQKQIYAKHYNNFEEQKYYLKTKITDNLDLSDTNPFKSKLQKECTENQPNTEAKPTQKLTNENILQTPNYDLIATKDTGVKFSTKTRQRKKFRAKLVAITYAIILTLLGGWVIYNAYSLNETKYHIIQYILKIEQLDNVQQVNDGNGTFVSNIITIEPQELQEPTEIQIQTNWFDRFCSWVVNMFGG